jgi:hypothetical protein
VAADLEKNQTTTSVNEERRKQNRYRLRVPVIFSWRDARQAQHEAVGLTRDLSLNSAFVLSKVLPPLQANIKLKAFPPPVVGVAARLQICGEGKVIRVEAIKHHDTRGGFAVVGKHFVLRRGGTRR